jgi:ATP synthase protein I
MTDHDDQRQRLRRSVERQAHRLRRAEHRRHAWLAYTGYIGTLGLVMVLPVVAGAYLGLWLDERLEGFSVSWTVSLICIGIGMGAINAYLLIRDGNGSD